MELAESRSNVGGIRSCPGQVWSKFVERGPLLVEIGPAFVDSGPKLVEVAPNLAGELARLRPLAARCWHDFGTRSRLRSAQIRPKFGRSRPELVLFGREIRPAAPRASKEQIPAQVVAPAFAQHFGRPAHRGAKEVSAAVEQSSAGAFLSFARAGSHQGHALRIRWALPPPAFGKRGGAQQGVPQMPLTRASCELMLGSGKSMTESPKLHP